MKIAIISTYTADHPNIGDRAITTSTIAALRHLYGPATQFATFLRRDDWNTVAPDLSKCDCIVFACLAIRNNMQKTYRFLPQICRIGVPYGVLAAGTSLNVSAAHLLPAEAFVQQDIAELRECAAGARFFTTRGALTQATCEDLGIANASMGGDIVFFDRRFDRRTFRPLGQVRHIAISDPHYATRFRASFECLTERLRTLFPDARIDLLLHGPNELSRNLALQKGIGVRDIYLDLDNGLDAYDEYDLHVGYRVHGHVSALSRRKPSYLLEQDGRGSDYALSFSRKMSVPNYRPMKPDARPQAYVTPVELLMSMLRADCRDGFARFFGLEAEIRRLVELNLRALSTFDDLVSRRQRLRNRLRRLV